MPNALDRSPRPMAAAVATTATALPGRKPRPRRRASVALAVAATAAALAGCGNDAPNSIAGKAASTAARPAAGAAVRAASLRPVAATVAMPGAAADAAPRSAAPVPAGLGPHAQRLIDGFLLNALVVPLIDADASDGARWADPSLNAACDELSHVTVDGRRVVAGERLPGRAFTVRWHLVGCHPFGPMDVALDGDVELQVYPDDDGLSAAIALHDVIASDGQGQARYAERRYAVRVRWTL